MIDKIMTCWIGAAFGVMESVVTDNGGEFSSAEMREVCSILNVEKVATAAESPFQNGLCERNHGVVDNMLSKLEEQCSNTPSEILLAWANMAKNSLQMWHGFSSYQLVFGRNPNLSNIMTDQAPALEGSSTSEVLVRHLNGLHAARRAFIESEASERVKRALRSKIRASERKYSPGDRVYYKRETQERWLGPAKVIFQDGKVIFVRHGATFVRVSSNRLLPAGQTQDKIQGRGMYSTRGDDFNGSGFQSKDFQQAGNIEEITGCDNKEETVEARTCQNLVEPIQHKHQPIVLKKNDHIQYRINESDDWSQAVILSRGGKVTGNHKNWYNIKDEMGAERGINLDKLNKLEKIDEENKDKSPVNEEESEVYMVMIPKEKHDDSKCVEAKQTELEKLKEFRKYEEVRDVGQFRISTTWVLWNKEEEVKVRLEARGYEDEQISNLPSCRESR